MSYSVKEIYYTLQGEGARTGRAAVFLRFAGCNLWSGLERDRADAVCRFCDTDFVGTNGVGGGKFATAAELARAVSAQWPKASLAQPYVVCTGGEPLLQIDDALVEALHAEHFEIGVETNGTLLPPAGIEWVCVSPKADAELKLTKGNELKLVYPQAGAPPERYAGLLFDNFFLQPMDDARRDANTRDAAEYCLAHPQWRLSLQTHKLIGIR
ncbi:MAG: 7-carboxy-7-deazaguanine synthase [Alphaproteobacteria bacterium]|nr:7-carboxy-7-deazaguanine synthase [Alphaproteobacteria bacterium]